MTAFSRAAFAICAIAGAASAQPPATREVQARARAEEAERRAIVALASHEMVDVPPETFHGAPGPGDRSVNEAVVELLLLDQALRLTRHGGVVNLDRFRAAARAERRRTLRDATRAREVLEPRVHPSRGERDEAARTAVSLGSVLAAPAQAPAPPPPPARSKAAPDTPAPPRPAAAFVPVTREELRRLKDKYRAHSLSLAEQSEWIERLTRDPPADAEWAEAERRSLNALRQLAVRRPIQESTSLALGDWIADVWARKDPLGLGLMASILAVLGAAIYVVFRIFRRDA